MPELEEPYGRLPGLDIMLHSQINAHKESLPFLMSKKWEAVQFLKGFFKESDPMLVSFEYLPCRVRFAEDPSELVFDYRLPIRSNIDHILGDEENLTRIPASLMGEGNSLLLRRAFEGAVVEAARRAAANYTLAVPQFYGGRIQLLLPLCLTGDKPELALTIQREDGFYAARTCLTLDMAYNNARLICRPETSWIKR